MRKARRTTAAMDRPTRAPILRAEEREEDKHGQINDAVNGNCNKLKIKWPNRHNKKALKMFVFFFSPQKTSRM